MWAKGKNSSQFKHPSLLITRSSDCKSYWVRTDFSYISHFFSEYNIVRIDTRQYRSFRSLLGFGLDGGHVIDFRVRKHQNRATFSMKVWVCPCERCTNMSPVSSHILFASFLRSLSVCWQSRAGGPRLDHVCHAALCHMPSLSRRSCFYFLCVFLFFCSLKILSFFF